MIGIDLFAGAGGMSVGAQRAGVNVIFAIEKDSCACQTYSHNHPDVTLLEKDIREVKTLSFNRDSEVVIFGGPPCKGFSTSNQRTRNINNPNNQLYQEYLRFVRLFKPEWLVFENVRGILETENGVFVEAISNELSALGYTLSDWLLNAAQYGVPQKRNRLFIIGSLNGIKVSAPVPTVLKSVTVHEAVGDLPVLENGASVCTVPYSDVPPSLYAKQLRGNLTVTSNNLVTRNSEFILERYKHIPQGGNWENIPADLMQNYTNREKCHTGIYYRLSLNEPSKVIGNFRKNMLIHPIQNRGLSVREAARLQSFPDSFVFKGSIGFQQEQVGNAVPPLLAEAVFKKVIESS